MQRCASSPLLRVKNCNLYDTSIGPCPAAETWSQSSCHGRPGDEVIIRRFTQVQGACLVPRYHNAAVNVDEYQHNKAPWCKMLGGVAHGYKVNVRMRIVKRARTVM